jgi:hypothetical protein
VRSMGFRVEITSRAKHDLDLILEWWWIARRAIRASGGFEE